MSQVVPIEKDTYSRPLQIFAKVISFVFHPLFITLYIALYMVYVQRVEFLSISELKRSFILIHVIIFNVFFPAFSIFLLYKLDFIDSIHLHTQKSRIIPYIISMIFFFWSYLVFRNNAEWPGIMMVLYFGIFLCISLGLVLNSFFKISIHGMGVGGALGFFVILLLNGLLPSIFPLIVVILITGVVCTSRLILHAHRPFEVYMGLFIGITSQLIASKFISIH